MSLAEQLSGETVPCLAHEGCWNGPTPDRIASPPVCKDCKFAERFGGLFNYWSPIRKGERHPKVMAERLLNKTAAEAVKLEKRRGRDRDRMEVQRKAKLAERQTDKNIISATRNSGRSNRDGDHSMSGRITLDTKLQMMNANPVVHISELVKVTMDARRAGNGYGGLVLRNRSGVGVVALFEEDFARLVKELANVEVQGSPVS